MTPLAWATLFMGVLGFGMLAVGMLLAFRTLDHARRIERSRAGLPEEPRPKPPEREPMPESVRELIEPWSSAVVRRALSEDCHALRRSGAPWSEIERMLREQSPA